MDVVTKRLRRAQSDSFRIVGYDERFVKLKNKLPEFLAQMAAASRESAKAVSKYSGQLDGFSKKRKSCCSKKKRTFEKMRFYN